VWRPLTLPLGLVALLAFLVTLQPEFTPFVPGANDNASGAAAVLALAARLRAQPLQHTEVWLVNSGAEEVGATGPVQLLRRHPALRQADWIVLDTIAGPGAGPCVITAEQVLLPLWADPKLLQLAREVAAARPDLGTYEHYYRGLFSEHSPLVAAGCRSLAIIDFTPQGVLPHWHRPTDTFANIDPQVLDRTEEFAWGLLQAIDRRAS
jgi:Zn-dependent M28 family amino/carboxypeptidase